MLTILLISCLFGLIGASETSPMWDQYGSCLDPSKAQSPIQLAPPFSHIGMQCSSCKNYSPL